MDELDVILWLQNKVNRYAYAIGEIVSLTNALKGGTITQETYIEHIEKTLDSLRKDEKKLNEQQKLD